MRFDRQVLTTCVLLASVLCRPATASTVVFLSDADLIKRATRIVHARVIDQRTVRPQASKKRLYTVTTLDVLEDFTGKTPDRLEVAELGGTLDNEVLYVGGQVAYHVGEEVLVCLEHGPHGFRSEAMGLSKFKVRRTSADDGVLLRDLSETTIVGGVLPVHAPTLAEFRRLAATVLHKPSQRRASSEPLTVSAAEPYTNIGGQPGWRWKEPDSGQPVIFYRNARAAAPLANGDGVAEIQTALAAWTRPSSSSLVLQYGGTADESNIEGTFTSIPSRSGLISFDDPDDEIPAPVLAIGGGHASIRTGGSVHGVTYDGFDNGWVIFQDSKDLPATYKQSLDFTRVLTHEIGHAVGFDHTQPDGSVSNPTANIMYASCCYAQSPVPPALGPDDLAGLTAIYPADSVTAGPAMTIDKSMLRFGAVSSINAFTWSTAPQEVRLSQQGTGSVTWTATSTQPWLRVSPASGTGPATLTISVAPSGSLPMSGTVEGAITLTYDGASSTTSAIEVALNLVMSGRSTVPFGALETPQDNSSGITGAIPVTGWTLDDIEVDGVSICRAPVAGEPVAADARCGGFAQIFVGAGVFIEGARPDVQAAFPEYPVSGKAGWGFMVLTNMLPNQGNGSFHLWAYAQDREGHSTVLGARTIICDNAHATKPFGAIDTPTQGGIVSGSNYTNFGWALTPQPATIPQDGSTIAVLVDGVSIGNVTYNNFRSDVATAFPGLNNTNGAIGFKVIDTTTLTNGLHTIVWVVTDDRGVTEGIGSRYFTVSQGTSGNATAPMRVAAQSVEASAATAPIEATPVFGRRGWAPDAPWRAFNADATGRAVIRGEEIDRFELWFGDGGGSYTGYMRAGQTLVALPVGSKLDADSGIFTWAPGVGFVGTYDLVFVRWVNGQAAGRKNVRVILAPKGSAHVGAQVVIDTPRAHATLDQPFLLGGWAVDLDAAVGTGIDTLHVWAYPVAGGAPVFLGATVYGGARPDVAAIHGEQFRNTGFGINVQSLPSGTYDLAVFPWSNVTGGFLQPKSVRVTVR